MKINSISLGTSLYELENGVNILSPESREQGNILDGFLRALSQGIEHEIISSIQTGSYDSAEFSVTIPGSSDERIRLCKNNGKSRMVAYT